MKKFSGQAGLDFLMTYGWALLIIVLVIGVLFALGVFNVGSFTGNRAAGFASVGVTAWKVDAGGTFDVQFSNRYGSQINVSNISYKFDSMPSSEPSNITSFTLGTGATSPTVTIANPVGGYTSGDYYTVAMTILYTDMKTGFTLTDSGTLTGKVN